MELAARHASEPPPVGIELIFTVAEEDGLRGAKALDIDSSALAVRLRDRPREPDRRGDRRRTHLPAADRRLRGRRGARRDQPRGRPQRDRRRRRRGRGDGAGAPRRGDHRQRRDHRGRDGVEHRRRALPDPRRGAQHRPRSRRGDGRLDGRRLHLGRERARLRRRRAGDRDVPRLPHRLGLGAGAAGDRGAASAAGTSRAGPPPGEAATPTR